MSEENKKYIPEGVLLVCDKGTITSQLIANERKITLYGLTQATDKDNVFEKNILSFGACKTLKGPCCFDCVEWSKTKLGSYYLNGEKPLLEHSEAICKVGGGTIKIYLDDYDAEKAVKKNNENPFVAEKISSLLLGIFLTKDLSAIWSLTSDEDTYTEGVGRGFKKGAEGTANFLMEDMWKQETWDAMGNTLVVGLSYIIPSTTPGVDNTSIFLSWLDSMCDTEFVKTKVQLEDAVGKSVDNTIEAYDRGDYGAVGEVVGQTQYMIVEGVVGSKGVGLLAKGVTNTAKVLIGVERLAVLSTKISKLANAIKTGILKVVRVGRKFKFHTPLTNDVFEEAMRIINTTSAKSRGPCLSGIYDPATSKTYYGINFKATPTGKMEYTKWLETPAELGGADPIIKQMVKEYEAKIAKGEITLKEMTDTKLAAHSELRALDQAFKARREAGIPVDRKSIKEMSLSNRDLQPKVLDKNNGIPPLKIRCQNCEYLTDGIQLHGHK